MNRLILFNAVFFMIISLCRLSVIAQNQDDSLSKTKIKEPISDPFMEDDYTFTTIETMPMPKEGMAEFYKYITHNFKYPPGYARVCVEGKIFLRFNVQKDGSLTDIDIIKGLYPDLDSAAIRVLREYPHPWNPGTQGGRVVKTGVTIPISICRIYDCGCGRLNVRSDKQKYENISERESTLRSDSNTVRFLDEKAQTTKVSIFPNPVVDDLTIKLSSSKPQTIEIKAQNGLKFFKQIVVVSNKTELKDYFEIKINVRSWPRGIYILSIKDRFKTSFHTIILH